MKRIFIMVFAACIITSLTSCKQKTTDNKTTTNTETVTDEVSPDEDEDVQELAYKTILVKDEAPGKYNVMFRFDIDIPVQGPKELVSEINRNILYILDDSTNNNLSEKYLHNLAKKYINQSVNEIKEFGIDSNSDYVPSYGYTGSIKMEENTDNYVTYMADSYIYSGGAHGMPYKDYITISKITNKALGLDDIILKDKHKELKKILKKYIVEQYYHGESPEWGGMFRFELPVQSPALTVDGVRFYYGAYEIDCYAAGMPHCTIPYSKISSIMTPEAKKLIL